MNYKIVNSGQTLSKAVVMYCCPACATNLKNPLKESGEQDQCPECGIAFEVPGKKEYEELILKEEAYLAEQKQEAEKEKEILLKVIEEEKRKRDKEDALRKERSAEAAEEIITGQPKQSVLFGADAMVERGQVITPGFMVFCFLLSCIGMFLQGMPDWSDSSMTVVLKSIRLWIIFGIFWIVMALLMCARFIPARMVFLQNKKPNLL